MSSSPFEEHRDDPYIAFDGHDLANEPSLQAAVEKAYRDIEAIERQRGLRKRARRPADVATAKAFIESAFCTAVKAHLVGGLDVTMTLDKAALGNPGRYLRRAAFSKLNRHLLEVLSMPERPWLTHIIGHYAGGGGRMTTVRAGKLLAEQIEAHRLDFSSVRRNPAEEIVILKGDKTKGGKAQWVDYTDTEETNRLRAELREFNDFMQYENEVEFHGHLVSNEELPVDETAVRLRRYFNRGTMALGGRLWGAWWQTLPKRYRDGIVVNGEHVADLDYRAMSVTLLYSIGAMGQLLPDDDPYLIEGLEDHREAVKTAMLAMLNCETRRQCRLQGKEQELVESTGWPMKDIIDALLEKHHPVAHMLFPGKGHHPVGLRLMRKESDLILGVMRELMYFRVPALNMHDGIMVPHSEAPLAETIMVAKAWDHCHMPVVVTSHRYGDH